MLVLADQCKSCYLQKRIIRIKANSGPGVEEQVFNPRTQEAKTGEFL